MINLYSVNPPALTHQTHFFWKFQNLSLLQLISKLHSLSLLTTEKLLNQIMELKFTSKSIQRQAKKCEKEEKSEKLKIKKAMEKGNIDGARIYAENVIQKRTEQMNYLRLDVVVALLDTQAKMSTISKFQNCGLIFLLKSFVWLLEKRYIYIYIYKNYCGDNGRVEKEWRLEMGLREERDLEKKWFRAGG